MSLRVFILLLYNVKPNLLLPLVSIRDKFEFNQVLKSRPSYHNKLVN